MTSFVSNHYTLNFNFSSGVHTIQYNIVQDVVISIVPGPVGVYRCSQSLSIHQV